MKKRLLTLLAAVLLVFCLTACGGGTTTTPPTLGVGDEVAVTALSPRVEIKDTALESYDFTTLFHITVNGDAVTVKPEYVSTANLQTAGYVTCDYQGKQAIAVIDVIPTVYDLALSVEEVMVKESQALNYDYLALFSATADGSAGVITQDMIATDVAEEVGIYHYTVTFGGKTQTLTVKVTPDHLLETIVSYRELPISLADLATFDYTSLFSLFVDGMPVQVTREMLDLSGIVNCQVGERYTVSLTYTEQRSSCTAVATLLIVEEEALTVTARNIVTYPNGEVIDLPSLFTVKKGNTLLSVTSDMITGQIDYSSVGMNQITLTYPGHPPVTAQVEVKRGVVIIAPETVTVRLGTDIALYPFEGDFTVIVNGLRFTQIPMSCYDLSGVDFSQAGSYPVKLTIPYNDQKPSGLSGNVQYQNVEKTVVYQVIDRTYSITLKQDKLILPVGTTSYDPKNNLNVVINGRNQTLTDNPLYEDSISCYAEVIGSPVDFAGMAEQRVEIAVYVNGHANPPEIISYTLRIDANITVTATGAFVFCGHPLSIRNLFTVTEGQSKVDVTYDMIAGKVDIFTPGVYTVSIDYKGITEQAEVVVLDANMLGTYHTKLTTIPKAGVTDADGQTVEDGVAARLLKDLVISADGTVSLNGSPASIVGGINGTTAYLKYGSYFYTLCYDNGIVTLDPENAIRMNFTENKRPMVYFHEDKWTAEEKLTVNYGSAHVLELQNVTTYSIDLFRLTEKATGNEVWYGMKVQLAEKMSSDYVYRVGFGVATMSKDFVQEPGNVSSFTLEGIDYPIILTNRKLAQIDKSVGGQRLWAGKIFNGMFEGTSATLIANSYEHFSLKVGSETVFTAGNTELNQMKYGGPDYTHNLLSLYSYTGQEFPPYSYKFTIDPQNNSFTLLEKDKYYGKYVLGDYYIFLDGYGMGVMNFNKKQYAVTTLMYEEVGQELHIRFLNTLPTFTYGEEAVFYTSPLLNTLQVKSFTNLPIAGLTFVNEAITDGAVVSYASRPIGAGSDGLTRLYEQITIFTKDGELDATAKRNCIDTSAVKWTAPGFYQFKINISVDGKTVTSYYAVQILPEICAGKAVAKSYGKGVIYGNNSFALDAFGRVSFPYGDEIYEGIADVSEDGNSFTARVYNTKGVMLALTGSMVNDGMMMLKVAGTTNITELYTTGTTNVIGAKGLVLRTFTVGGNVYYRLASSPTSVGEDTLVTLVSGADFYTVGAILKLQTAEKTYYAQVQSWGSVSDGLTLADSLRGVYTKEGQPSLTLDGFGNAEIDGKKGTYRQNGSLLTVTGATLKAYRLNVGNMTYEEEAISLTEKSFENKIYTATYDFICSGYAYTATTTFTFASDGKVLVQSVSPAHDDGEEGCEEDRYSPLFATAKGVNGTFSIALDRLTVTANGYTFTFLVPNVVLPDSLISESSSLPSSAQGYIKPSVVFTQVNP